MTKEELDFIGSMNMCDEISNEAYKKIVCHCEEQEPSENTISRQAVFDAMRKNHRSGGRDIDGDYIEGDYRESLYDDVISIPSVTPQPKVGHWINAYPDIEPNPMFMYGICSVCGCEQSISNKLNFCPTCGAKMQEAERQDNE